jgi:hypothetical protein
MGVIMKQFVRTLLMAAFAVLVATGCAVQKKAGDTCYVSVQYAMKHEQPDANSKTVGTLKMGDSIVVNAVIPQQGHLATDQADPWIKVAEGDSFYYIPGNTIISQDLWKEQLSGLPPKGEAKVKNFTSARRQKKRTDLKQADLYRGELFLLLGANGNMSSEDGVAYSAELGEYLKVQSKSAADLKIKLPEAKTNFTPNPKTFFEIGPYQEFDMGTVLASLMIKDAIAPDHPVTLYVKSIVDRLVKHSTLPYAYSGFHVFILKDDETVNACAAPGGFIFVTTGMLKYLNSEEELALILAHEIGHLEFHHSVRELSAVDYAGFALSALVAGIDLNDPKVQAAIIEILADAYEVWLDGEIQIAKILGIFGKEPPTEEEKKAAYAKFVNEKTVAEKTAEIQELIEDAKDKVMDIVQQLNGKLTKGHDVEFEAAADRRAVSLAAAAGYDADALLSVLSRIKADNGGFGEAYPVNRDELVKQFKESYKVAAPAVAVGDYQAIRTQVEKITAADLFIKNK